MQEQNQQFGNPMSRPMARPSAIPQPIQRGNYGTPSRVGSLQPMTQPTPQPAQVTAPAPQLVREIQPIFASAPQPTAPNPVASYAQQRPAPAPNGPQFMDFAPSRPATTSSAQPPIFRQAPEQPVAVEEKRPLFTPSTAAREDRQPSHHANKFKLVKGSLLGLAAVLIIAGGVRFVSAGNTTNDTIAVGAVSANDGRSMTIQFTATDGKLHKYSTASNRDLIPGSAVEVAYRSGAPEATVRQVSIVKDGRNMGILIAAAGVVCLSALGIIATAGRIKNRGKHHGTPLTTTVSV